jgi:hypothetical protein
MNEEAIKFYARKFFPHLTERYGVLAVLAIIEAHKKP